VQAAKAVYPMKLRYSWLPGGSIPAVAMLLVSAMAYAQTPPGTSAPQREEETRNALFRAVRHQLLQLPFYSVFDYVDFSIDGDKVTLTGQVQRPTLKTHAEAAVKSLEGVGSVVNNIETVPASASDHELGRNIYRAIYEDAILQKYAVEPIPSIHIIVKNGYVTLEGAVNSEADKTLAGGLAGKVANSTGLRNNLVVRKKESPAR
jgi:hyperosmotically inducible periplasmic protein